jgi:hypothetical protein
VGRVSEKLASHSEGNLVVSGPNSSGLPDSGHGRAPGRGLLRSAQRADNRPRVATEAVWVLVIANDPVRGVTPALWVLVFANDPRVT